MRGIKALACAAAMGLAPAAPARDLAVPAGKGWRHAETGLTLTAALDGLPRSTLRDTTATEHDVMAEFTAPDGATTASVFLFHPGVFDVAMWFERAEAAIYDRALFGDVAPTSPDPIAFAVGTATPGSALRRVYAPGKGPYRSTGLAAVPVGEWLAVVRLSSKVLAPSELDARLDRVLAAIRWPAATVPARPAVPIAACPAPLAFAKAKQVAPQGADLLMPLLMAVAVSDPTRSKAKDDAPPRWCRDASSTTRYGVYRSDASTGGYVMALNDAGRTVSVDPSLAALSGKAGGVSVSLTDVDGMTSAYGNFDRLPAPTQVMKALERPALGSTRGTTISIDPKALK